MFPFVSRFRAGVAALRGRPGGRRSRVRRGEASRVRRGVTAVTSAISLVTAIGFTALSVDIAVIAYTKTRLQNAADAAALAAAQEITLSVRNAGSGGGSASDANAVVSAACRAMAARVVSLNGFYIDPNRDVRFGRRGYDKGTGKFVVQWGATPYNTVKVTIRMDNPNPSAPDAPLRLLFAPVFGVKQKALTAEAAGFVEARDMVMVLDYTGSMNDDSTFAGVSSLGRSAVEANQLQIFQQLGLSLPNLPDTPEYVTVSGAAYQGPTVNVTFKGPAVTAVSSQSITSLKLTFDSGATQTFSGRSTTLNASGSGSNSRRYVTRADVTSGSRTVSLYYNTTEIKRALGLNTVSYPYPGGNWDEYIEFTNTYSFYSVNYGYDLLGGYEWKFGKKAFVNYLLEYRPKYTDTPALWRTSHYPFHAMKGGASLFCQFLDDLDFGDHLGLVSYDEAARFETRLYEPYDGTSVDISATPITDNYAAIDAIQKHKQAGHYASSTGIGFGLEKGLELLQTKGRYGARPTLLLMTDGNANVAPSGWRMPYGWNWNTLTDYDGDGRANYTTTDVNKQYSFYQAKRAIDAGCTIHTLSVGAGADRDLMRGIAFAGGGEYVDVPGGGTIEKMETDLRAAFKKIAGNLPPAKLLVER